MKNKVLRVFAFCALFSFAAGPVSALSIGVLNGPSGIPSSWLMENVSSVNGQNVTYEVYGGANLLLPKLIRGEVDVGILPPNVAAKAYNSSKSIKVVAVTGYGMLSLVTRDRSIHSLADLKGKTVAVAGQGATPEYLFSLLLKEYGLTGGISGCDVTFDFSIPNADIAAALISGKIQYALVPEPFATVACSKDSSIFRAIDIQKEASEHTDLGANYPMSVMVVNAEFERKNPDIVRALYSYYETATNWTVKNAASAAALSEKYSLGLPSSIVVSAIPYCNFGCASFVSSDVRESLESLLKVFLEFNPASIGGTLPDEGFYFK